MGTTKRFVIPDHFTWWRDRLDGWTKVSGGYMAICPAHDDLKPSLHFTVNPTNEDDFVFHCFAGCKYLDIVSAATATSTRTYQPETNGNGHDTVPNTSVLVDTTPTAAGSFPLDWWERYTGVPRAEWESWDVRDGVGRIEFTWPIFSAVKVREVGGKDYKWSGAGKPSGSVLWPHPEGRLEGRGIWIGEGESDTGILRHLGFPAYTWGGVDNFRTENVVSLFRAYGIEHVTLCLDCDTAGKKSAKKVATELLDADFRVTVIDISPLVDARKYENDVRNAFSAVGEELRLGLLQLSEKAQNLGIKMTADEYQQLAPEDLDWVVEPMLMRGSLTLFSGAAKSGKTTFTFSLLRELGALGTGSFLGKKVAKGSVLYMTEDSPIAWKAKEAVHFPHSRAARMGGGLSREKDHVWVFPKGSPTLADMSWREILQQVERELDGVSMLVVDTIPVWAGIEDENDSVEVGKALEPLRRLAEKKNVAILAIHYHNKNDGRRGSTTFDAIPDILLDLDEGKTDELDDVRIVRVRSKLSAAPEDIVYVFNAERGVLDIVKDTKSVKRRQGVPGGAGVAQRTGGIEISVTKPVHKQALLNAAQVLSSNSMPVTFSSMCTQAGVSENNNARNALDTLVETGALLIADKTNKPFTYAYNPNYQPTVEAKKGK